MQLNQGASVFTADGTEAGRIDRVVIDPKTNEVSHIVVRKGFFLPDDKVVPMSLMMAGPEDRIVLRINSDKLGQLPEFEETHYIALNEEELGRADKAGPIGIALPALYWYPPYRGTLLVDYPEPPYIAETRTNIPEGTIAVKAGAKVITRDDKDVGNVEQVLTNLQADRVTHCLISKGLVMKEKRLIPVGWIDSWSEDELRLAVGSNTVERLPVFEHA
jgi:uncharacterized protein YrrD